MKTFTCKIHHHAGQRGFSLIEVLVGIGIFAIGMLALGSLQGALTRSTAEAKIRTTAVNIAERVLEEQQGFAQVTGGTFSYTSIVDVTTPIVYDGTMTRSPGSPVGVRYYVTQDVTDYYYDLVSDSFTETKPTGVSIPDYKTVIVHVEWTDDLRDFVVQEGTETTGNLGGGSVEVSTTISKMSTVNAVQVAEQDDSDIIAPDIVYTPGDNPDIVSLGLGDNKFKESLTPEPKVYRDNLETRFDVVTYSQSNAGAFFLRREEFVAVSCDCTLNAASAENPGNTPVVWAGDEYTDPVAMTKPYGTEAANVQQSPLCGACCRDHHDADGSPLYDPSRPSGQYGENGDHLHYYRQGGNWQVAGGGDDYVEACRFVRKDGFFRLTQDFRLEGLNTFAADYLVTDAQVHEYSDYVIGEVYDANDPNSYVMSAITLGDGYQLVADPPAVHTADRTASGDPVLDTDLTLGYTYLPTATSASFQQLRARSIYVDSLSSDLRDVIECLEGKSDTDKENNPNICDQGDVVLDRTGSTNILELIPFFEVQTTYLNDWQKENAGSSEFSLTNDTVSTSDASGPTHSRGKVTNLSTDGYDWVHITANRDVTAITSTDLINNRTDLQLPTVGDEWPPGDIEVITGAGSPSFDGVVVSGILTSEVNGLKAANVHVTGTETICDYMTTTGEFTCFIPTSASSPTLTVSGFDKPPKTIYLCSNYQWVGTSPNYELPVENPGSFSDPKDVDLSNALATPSNPTGTEPTYQLYLTEDSCPADPGGGWGG